MATNSEVQHETTVRDFLNVVFKRKWIIISVVLLATVLVFYLNTRQAETWESSARILVQRGEQGNYLTGSIRYLTWEEEVSSQIEVILSETVFNRAAEIFADSVAARGYPPDWGFASGRVRADVVGESNVFTIKYQDLNPRVALLGCRAMTLSFREYYRERKAPPALSDFFASEIADVRSDLDYWINKRNEFLNQEQFFGMTEESRYLLTQTSGLEYEMVEIDAEITMQAKRVENLEELTQKSGAELENELAVRLSRNFLQSGLLRDIKMDLQRLGTSREELLQKYTPKHPEVVAIDSQMQELRGDLKREVTNAYQIERQELDGLYAKKNTISKQLAVNRTKLEQLPDKDMELKKYDTMIANLQAKYDLLLERQSESDIALAVRPDWEVTVLSNASEPYSKKARDYVRLALGPFLAVIVALGLAFFLESMDHSVKNTAEAEEFLGLKVLTTVSEIEK
jgi:uncharacterized protein involved in exopolysaccharide biosynthesis